MSDDVKQDLKMDNEIQEFSKQKSNWFKRNWKFVIGIVLTIGLMSLLVIKSNPESIFISLQQSNVWLLLAASLTTLVLFVIKTLRWMLIIKQLGEKIPFFLALKLVLIGTFGSAITPAKIGDITRAFYLTKERETITTGSAVFSVVFDRILDFVGIFSVIIISIPFLLLSIGTINPLIPLGIAIGFVVTIIIITAAFSKKITKPFLTFVLKYIARMFKKEEAKKKINITTNEIIDDFYSSQKKYRLKQYFILGLLSIFFWIILGVQGALLLYSFGTISTNFIISIPIIVAVLCIAAIVALGIPISIGGVGVRDMVIQFCLLALLNVQKAHALNLSIIQTSFNVLIPAIIGAFILLNQTRQPKRKKLPPVQATIS